MKRALAIGGGGSKGAFAVGIVDSMRKDYDYYLGTSTGALVVCMVAAQKYDQLKKSYLDLNISKIFSKNPYNKNGKLSVFKILKRHILGKNSFGSTDSLLNFIRESFTEKDFQIVKRRGIEIIVTVTNLETNKTEFKSSKNCNYIEFTNWVWVSTLAYPFTEYHGIYADGGYTCPIPVVKACELANEVDAIILQEKNSNKKFNPKNSLKGISNIIGVFMRDILNEDLQEVEHLKSHKNLKVNYFFTPYKLTENSMFFDKQKMNDWYLLGKKQVNHV